MEITMVQMYRIASMYKNGFHSKITSRDKDLFTLDSKLLSRSRCNSLMPTFSSVVLHDVRSNLIWALNSKQPHCFCVSLVKMYRKCHTNNSTVIAVPITCLLWCRGGVTHSFTHTPNTTLQIGSACKIVTLSWVCVCLCPHPPALWCFFLCTIDCFASEVPPIIWQINLERPELVGVKPSHHIIFLLALPPPPPPFVSPHTNSKHPNACKKPTCVCASSSGVLGWEG